jgi:hypothetical protein
MRSVKAGKSLRYTVCGKPDRVIFSFQRDAGCRGKSFAGYEMAGDLKQDLSAARERPTKILFWFPDLGKA